MFIRSTLNLNRLLLRELSLPVCHFCTLLPIYMPIPAMSGGRALLDLLDYFLHFIDLLFTQFFFIDHKGKEGCRRVTKVTGQHFLQFYFTVFCLRNSGI